LPAETAEGPELPRLGDLSRRRLAATITGMATPVVLANLSQTLMGLVDTLMVGRLGEAPLAAVGVATLLFSALAMSIKHADVAAQTITARRVGQGRDDEVGAVLATALAVVLAIGFLLMIVGLTWPGFLMRLVSADPEVHELGIDYLRYRYAGMLPLLVFFIVKAVFDGIGWTRIGMGVGIGMNLANGGLNYVLIFGKLGAPAMGVAGAALASTISAALAALVILGFVLQTRVRKRFRFLARSNFHTELIRPFISLGWPPAVQTLGNITALLIFFFILGKISTQAVAAGNVVMRIMALSFMPGIGVSIAVQTLVGQSLGRRDIPGARRATWGGVGLSVAFMGAFGVAFLASPGFFLRLFTGLPELVAAGEPALRVLGGVQVIDAVGLTLAGALRGAGATRKVMIVDIISGFGLLPPLTYLFGIVLDGGLLGAFLALLTWFSLYAVGMTWLYFTSHWERLKV
jgi:MATE family multidrug resistance protein